MNQVILSLYFFIVIFIGYRSYKKIGGSKDYFIAGKNAGVREIAGSLLATVLGSSAIIGSVNFSYANGWAGSWFMLCAAFGLLGLLPYLLLPQSKDMFLLDQRYKIRIHRISLHRIDYT